MENEFSILRIRSQLFITCSQSLQLSLNEKTIKGNQPAHDKLKPQYIVQFLAIFS